MPSDQDEILAQFRAVLTEEGLLHDGDSIGTDDSTLKRFLRARKYNLRDSKKMWKDCQHWRSTVEGVGVDQLYRTLDPFDYPERDKVFKSWPMWFHKTDKTGRPLNVHFFGGMNMPELYKHVSPERHWQTVVVNCESLTREILPAASRAAGRTVDTCFVIVDLKGFSLSQFWQMKALARDSFQMSQDFFPETMGQLAIVNAPASFTFIWGIMKPWLSKETVAKIDIMGADYREVLLGLVDEESLPASLGGACKCEGGCEYSFAGPWKEGLEERRARRAREAAEVEGGACASPDGMPVNGRASPEGTVVDASPTASMAVPAKVGDVQGVQATAPVST
ncbi:CRAL/TRIO domain-containing protein [Athelia psychrophila]|uniref:CRAL/TRIO domain-containing protein n=1 Tax=Athelia psychrophila TaxID=1759441 RepID=A0A166W9Z7_9AGAM|nr:CRAL/TRIO domain-containing protein [Fibularhizoctonia sp. CBS 109695]